MVKINNENNINSNFSNAIPLEKPKTKYVKLDNSIADGFAELVETLAIARMRFPENTELETCQEVILKNYEDLKTGKAQTTPQKFAASVVKVKETINRIVFGAALLQKISQPGPDDIKRMTDF